MHFQLGHSEGYNLLIVGIILFYVNCLQYFYIRSLIYTVDKHLVSYICCVIEMQGAFSLEVNIVCAMIT